VDRATTHEFALMRSDAYGANKLQQRLEEASRRDALANHRLQSEMLGQLREAREKKAKGQVREMALMRAEAYKTLKLTRALEEESQREALANAQVQFELAAHAKRVRAALAAEQRRGGSETRYQAYKANKLQRELEAQSQTAALANARIQSEMQAHVSFASYDSSHLPSHPPAIRPWFPSERLLGRTCR
jgi:hypothetical protein